MTGAERGTHILEAVVEVIAERGLEGATMRNVAGAAGISLAQVQYYFRSKDELVAAAFRHVIQLFDTKLATVDLSGPPRRVLRQALELWLPLDEPRARDARVWLAFSAAATTSPTLKEIAASTDSELRVAFARLLDAAAAEGDLPDVTDTETEAGLLLAVIDGLVIQALALAEPLRPHFLTVSLETHLARLFTP
ncbi:TetR/AcrR family transcriptional regulator [Kribbella sancticallisti]|uniref:TetR/AcrR family transcriptional regulator n=1 Tax=Kribbella sancticallisti TaxID=460087 RepID=UPI0031DCF7CE